MPVGLSVGIAPWDSVCRDSGLIIKKPYPCNSFNTGTPYGCLGLSAYLMMAGSQVVGVADGWDAVAWFGDGFRVRAGTYFSHFSTSAFGSPLSSLPSCQL